MPKSKLKPIILQPNQYAEVIKRALKVTVDMMDLGQAKFTLKCILDGEPPKKAIEKAITSKI